MPLVTRREAIVDIFADRLRQIRIANGYTTDAGSAVYLGEIPTLNDPNDPNVSLAILPGDEEPASHQMEHVFFTWAIEIGAVVKIDATDAWRLVEHLIADIKQAVETVDRKLNGNLPDRISRGPVRQLPREAGSTTTGAAVTYLVPYPEPWGQPRIEA